jgi:hypothetical protein
MPFSGCAWRDAFRHTNVDGQMQRSVRVAPRKWYMPSLSSRRLFRMPGRRRAPSRAESRQVNLVIRTESHRIVRFLLMWHGESRLVSYLMWDDVS